MNVCMCVWAYINLEFKVESRIQLWVCIYIHTYVQLHVLPSWGDKLLQVIIHTNTTKTISLKAFCTTFCVAHRNWHLLFARIRSVTPLSAYLRLKKQRINCTYVKICVYMQAALNCNIYLRRKWFAMVQRGSFSSNGSGSMWVKFTRYVFCQFRVGFGADRCDGGHNDPT